jgi:hypothetical protein
MEHNHYHGGCCEHQNVRFCKKCGVPYCMDCGKEWSERCNLNHFPTPYYEPITNPWIYETPNTSPNTIYYGTNFKVTCNHES